MCRCAVRPSLNKHIQWQEQPCAARADAVRLGEMQMHAMRYPHSNEAATNLGADRTSLERLAVTQCSPGC